MDIMELGALGELVGGLAVIGSLIFVGIQLRQSNSQARDDAASEVSSQFDRFLETMMMSSESRHVWLAATEGPDRAPLANPANLTREELTLFAFVMYRAFHQFHSQFLARQDGTLDDKQWSKILPWIRMHVGAEAGLDWWEWAREGWFDSDFTAFIDSQVEIVQADRS